MYTSHLGASELTEVLADAVEAYNAWIRCRQARVTDIESEVADYRDASEYDTVDPDDSAEEQLREVVWVVTRVPDKISKSKISNRKISNAKYRKQNIEIAKYRNRKISKSQNIESQNIEYAKYRNRKISYRRISNSKISNTQNIDGQNIERKISNAKYRTQNIEVT